MSDERSNEDSAPDSSGGFQFSLTDIFLATTIIATSLGVMRAWDIGAGIWYGLLVTASAAVIRCRTLPRMVFLLFVVGSFGLGTSHAWNSYRSTGGYFIVDELNVTYFQSDHNYFDAFSCVLSMGTSHSVSTKNRVLRLHDRNVDFPDDVDVAIVNDADEVRFVTIPDHCFSREPGTGEFFMLGIPYPSFRSERAFKDWIDREALEKTSVWKDEIVPFLTGDANRKEVGG